jgi:cyclopropane-fatty-acyl-phospholipid synthase
MQFLLEQFLRRLVRHGRLVVSWPDGSSRSYGNGVGPAAAFALVDAATVRRLVSNAALAFGEAYMDGTLTPVGCDIYDVLEVMSVNLARAPASRLGRLRGRGRRAVQNRPANVTRAARRNVAHHYDLDARLYRLFLDEDQQYSCAYFATGQETLEEAQLAKKRHIAAKLKLDRPGLRVLDIGCGWGGMALTLARDHGCVVTGITLSHEQLEVARARAVSAGLDQQVRFELMDYRDLDARFDRIVSVGMFEHVGVAHYPAYFAAMRRCLAPGGVALVHTIGNSEGPSVTNEWLRKYIFPGGYSPALSEILPPVEQSGLIVTDVEVLRLHYARTLQHWRSRFADHRDEIACLYDARFCRMFEFYLAGAELAFRYGGEVVFQLQMTADLAALPLTRDYMLAAERQVAELVPRTGFEPVYPT